MLGACRGWGRSRRAELLAKLALGPRGQLLEGRINDSGLTGVLRMTSNIDILLESAFQKEPGSKSTEEKPQQRRVVYLFYIPKKVIGE